MAKVAPVARRAVHVEVLEHPLDVPVLVIAAGASNVTFDGRIFDAELSAGSVLREVEESAIHYQRSLIGRFPQR